MDVVLFDIEMNLSDRFQGTTPLTWKKEKARDVFNLLVYFNSHTKRHKKGKKQIIRKPAGDNWF